MTHLREHLNDFVSLIGELGVKERAREKIINSLFEKKIVFH